MLRQPIFKISTHSGMIYLKISFGKIEKKRCFKQKKNTAFALIKLGKLPRLSKRQHTIILILTHFIIYIFLTHSCFLRVDMMIDEWQDNIKPFTKSTERNNDTKKLRENIRFKTTGINVDKLTSTLILCFYYSLQ